jgi:integrase
MPFADVPAFLEKLRSVEGVSVRATEFTILTAARSGEVIGARWSEFDLKAKVWSIPAARMKAGREHRVPLSPRALAFITAMAETRSSDFVFPGAKRDQSLSRMAMAMLLRQHAPGVTVHGFRSAFRDWCGECTQFPRELAELSLAHVVGDATELAYRRGDALEKRRKLMDAWAAYCEARPANVVALRRAEAQTNG